MSLPGPSPAVSQALAKYKQAWAKEPSLRRLDLSRLAGIERGRHETELDLLDFAVASSLHDESKQRVPSAETLMDRLNDRRLSQDERRKLEEEFRRLQDGRWEHAGEPISFAKALHKYSRLTVIGDPGTGKTVLTRLAFLACTEGAAAVRARQLLCDDDAFDAQAVGAVQSLSELLPVRLSLGRLGGALSTGGLSMDQLIRDQLHAQKAPELAAGLGELLEAGRLFLLCDGLDEVAEEQRRPVVEALTAFFERYETVRLLVTSRPNGYRPRIPRLAQTQLAPLHPRQRRNLVTRLHRLLERREDEDAGSEARARHRTNALLRELQPGKRLQRLGGNPLLLTLLALSPTNEEGIPRHEIFVFENFIRTLLWEWRSALGLTRAEADGLMDVWSAVALALVRQEQRGGGVRALFIRLLGAVTRESADKALHLALETGLIQEEGGVFVFWHSTFAEFLAARALVRHGERGAAERILAEPRFPPWVLKFAAAHLDHVCGATGEVTALVQGLLDRDKRGAGQFLRPGLRDLSDCLEYDLRLDPELTERVWSTWADLLERTPPNPLWEVFGRLATKGPTSRLSPELLERFARIEPHGVSDVRDGIASLIAPEAADVPTARKLCEGWLERRLDTKLRVLGAFGLASAGEWSHEVIEVLGHFGRAYGRPHPEAVGERVRRGGEALRKELQELVRTPIPEPEAQRELRLSSALLLAVAGMWDGDVAEVLKQTLSKGTHREQDAKAVLKLRADSKPVRDALLDWMVDDSTLGAHARGIVQEVVPLVEGMLEEVLKRTAETDSRVRQELERLLEQAGEERRGLLDTLRRWLEDRQPERRMCAARLLRRFTPDDTHLHAALRRGMRSPDDATRAHWAWLAAGRQPELTQEALATLRSCARSGNPDVLGIVYEHMHGLMSHLEWKPLEGWLECARARELPVETRLAAAKLVSAAPTKDKDLVVPVLYELLEDPVSTIRREAASELIWRHHRVDARIVAVDAEEAARATDTHVKDYMYWPVSRMKAFASTAVQAILRGLPVESVREPKERDGFTRISWSSTLARLVTAEPSSLEHVLEALGRPGLVGEVATDALFRLMREQSFAREAVRQRLALHSREGASLREVYGLLLWGSFDNEETVPAAIEACRVMSPHELTQGQMEWLAGRLHHAGAESDAARLWRLALDGSSVERVLEAAEALAVHFPQETREWIQPSIARVLEATDPSLRVDAARVALRCGFLEEKAHAVLMEALERAGHPYKRTQRHLLLGASYESRVIAQGPEWNEALHDFRHEWEEPRVDAEAMHALCVYRPGMGIARLTAWLDDVEEARFRRAARFLAKREDTRDAVQAALTARLRTIDRSQLDALLHLAEGCGLQIPCLSEQVIARLNPARTRFDDDELFLYQWLQRFPDAWAIIRRQNPERRSAFTFLFQYRVPITRDAILFAVELAFEHVEDGIGQDALSFIEGWCKSRKEPSTPPPRTVRRWLRTALRHRTPPEGLHAILRFDRLAKAGRRLTGKRIEVLRRALSIDVTTATSDPDHRQQLFDLQVEAACLLHELGGRDERLIPVVEAAVYAFAHVYPSESLRRARTLLSLRPPNDSIRSVLQHAVLWLPSHVDIKEALEVLEQADMSAPRRIDILIERLHSFHHDSWLNEAPHHLEAMAALGHTPENITDLVIRLVSDHGAELSPWTLRALSEYPGLPKSTSTQLMLRALARDGRTLGEQWLARFTSQGAKLGYRDRWPGPNGEAFLSLRLRGLAKLSRVDDPSLVEPVLAELADASAADRLLALHRRALSSQSLSECEWDELAGRLSIQPGDDSAALLAKEWLSLGLWRALELETIDRLIQS
ncbi:NACHT domain-containing protein [Melittangium boletus]|uniref:NACHT domain-containing protein n=1 Tax=Melittangium boletus DSM 14713 TaxID=1294270 RepID=A0A250IMI3_9BACT|nr:NACHT domain-containing protein [Melittangium boletus]ATB32463.1 hypothetical protein MEBOL_005943 [Melittangium boletus DSM 14713]